METAIRAKAREEPGGWRRAHLRGHQSHADFLMLDVGIVQSDGDFHLVKDAEGVLLHCQSGALNTHTHTHTGQETFRHCWCCSRISETWGSYLFIKEQLGGRLVFGVKEDRPLQTEPGDEHDDGVLPHKQNEALFVQDASALEEQLQGDGLSQGQDGAEDLPGWGRYLCVEGHRGSLSILGHFMPVVEVAGKRRLLVFVRQIWVGAICSNGHSQQAVNNDVCVPVSEGEPRSKASAAEPPGPGSPPHPQPPFTS